MEKSLSDQQIGYIVRSYPRLSQTFILNEILQLERIGVGLRIFALANPREAVTQPEVGRVRARVHYLSPRAPWADHRAAAARFGRGYFAALSYALAGRAVDRGYHAAPRRELFDQAVGLALALARGRETGALVVDHLHAHFAHDPTFIAQLVHRMTGLPYSFTAHARDLYQVEPGVLVERICEAAGVVTCCRNNLNYLLRAAPGLRERFHLVYHGVNLECFHPAPGMGPAPLEEPPLILSIGRLIEKKGFFDLLRALRLVKDAGLTFRCEIYGEGPLEQPLLEWIAAHGLAAEVKLAGFRPQHELVEVYQSAALFALAPYVTGDGDQDGIPNVLTEAMAVGLPVVSTRAAGVPELVAHRQNGLLYEPHDAEGIAAGIRELLSDGQRRVRFGRAARRRVVEQFDVTRAALHLRELFAHGMRAPRPAEVRLFGKPACA
jgi:glycosyltransferase involved in cell wall biosynthesis